MKRVLSLVFAALLLMTTLAACGGSADAESTAAEGASSGAAAASEGAESDGGASSDVKATLTFATWDNEAMLLYDELDIEGRFQELYPNVSLEIEEFMDDEEYYNQMKIRASANELPDLMFTQPRKFPDYKDFLVDLSETEAAANSALAAGYALDDGRIVGIPEKQGGDYVFYWADKFEEAGVEVPQTWDEFVEVLNTLQAFYGADDPDYMAVAMGAKDEWPVYPFMEYGPASFSGNGNLWADMTKTDAPFAEGEPLYEAYSKINTLFSGGVLGRDPLGIGYDQALALFLQKKGGVMIDSSLGLAKMRNSGEDLSTLKSFYLPYTAEDGSINHAIQGDFYLGVTTNAQDSELAMAFLEFYFSDAWYPDYINALSSESAMSTVEKEKDPVFATADEVMPEINLVMYVGGSDDFTNMQNATQFNYNKLGGEMLMDGFDLEARFEELNTAWAEARAELGLA